MEGLDRISIPFRPGMAAQEQLKPVKEQKVAAEDICMDVEDMKSFLYMMSGIDYEPKVDEKDHWA